MLSILFVCSGNTCRSPMAEAIAQHWLTEQEAPLSSLIRFASAGTHVKPNASITKEAIVALEKKGMSYSGASQALTLDLIKDYDVVIVMTQVHLAFAQNLIADKELPGPIKLITLDPQQDIDDPLGKGQKKYDELVEEFLTLIPKRMESLIGCVRK